MPKIQKNILLSKHSTFGIGGPAGEFAEVANKKELKETLEYARNKKMKLFILGGGSNVLFADKGFDGLVIKLASQNAKREIKVRKENSSVEFWAGEALSEAVNFAKNNSLAGLENLVGIPGTIGGAVWGNAGAFGSEIGDRVEKAEIIKTTDNEEIIYQKDQCGFKYRDSIFKRNPGLIIASVVLKLPKGDKKEIEKKMKETLKKRLEKQPAGWHKSAGSFFKNPEVKNKKIVALFEKDKGIKSKDGKVPAGWLIAEAGLLGKIVGGAKVSEKHGNFIVNAGFATAEDVLTLASVIKEKVRVQFGVELKEEARYVE